MVACRQHLRAAIPVPSFNHMRQFNQWCGATGVGGVLASGRGGSAGVIVELAIGPGGAAGVDGVTGY